MPGRGVAEIVIPFLGADEQMFQRIEQLSSRNRRTNAAQILVWLETLVHELQSDHAEK